MDSSRLDVVARMLAMAGWPVLVVPGARGTLTSLRARTCPRVSPVSFATAPTTASPCSIVAAVSGLVPGVEARLPRIVVAWPRYTLDVAE